MSDDLEITLPQSQLNFKNTAHSFSLPPCLKADPTLPLLAHASKYSLTFILNDFKIKIFKNYSKKYSLIDKPENRELTELVADGEISITHDNYNSDDQNDDDSFYNDKGLIINKTENLLAYIEKGTINIYSITNSGTIKKLTSDNKLSNNNKIIDFKFSPKEENDFILVTETGGLVSGTIKNENGGTSIELVTFKPYHASCCAYSPKGKQIVVGMKDQERVTFEQFTWVGW